MVVRGVVRRVVRGVGSVGSPRSGGQFFQLSLFFFSQLCICSPVTFLKHQAKIPCFILNLNFSFKLLQYDCCILNCNVYSHK